MMNRKRKTIVSCLLSFACLTSLLFGCGETETAGNPKDVTLVEPVGVAANYEVAVKRNLYSHKVYAGYLCPTVKEYSFDTEEYEMFSEYAAYPGEKVSEGEALVYGDTQSMDDQIENLKTEMDEMKKNHETSVKESNEGLKNMKASGMASAYEIKRMEEKIKEEKELYELDYAYKKTQLEFLKEDLNKKTLIASQQGIVMATKFVEEWREKRFLHYGDWVNGSESLVAVGDLSRMVVRCEYMSSTTVNRAKELYAIINGERYELEYQAYDSDEYKRLSEMNDKVYSSFTVKDLPENLPAGTYVTVVLVNDARMDVVTVSKEAVTKDDSGSFVYVLRDGETQYTAVKTGLSDGSFVEILSGLEEGDKVLSSQALPEGNKFVKVDYGSVAVEFSTTGYLTYPSYELVTNPVEYGSCYFDELCVSTNQQVKKGDVLAKVHVEADAMEMQRVQKQLQREQERLADLKKAGSETNQFAIERKEETIQSLKEQIADRNAAYAVKEIRSPISGIVITKDENLKEGDLLSRDQALFQVADESLSYIMVDDDNNQLTYGNQVMVTYKDKNGQEKKTEGMVVTLNQLSLNKSLLSKKALIMVSTEALGDMAGSSKQGDGWWSRTYYNVNATLRKMDHVLLVPKKAVTEKDGQTYVKLKKDSGELYLQSFIAGGSDSTYYWVAEGLTEGMEICLE